MGSFEITLQLQIIRRDQCTYNDYKCKRIQINYFNKLFLINYF